jgi:flagellar basal-body rod protein FlgF
MEGANLILTSYQDSLTTAMDVIANNVANVNTTGFKRETVAFDSYILQPTPKDSFRFSLDDGIYRDTSSGAVIMTGNPLDVALQGPGYLSVETDKGTHYTRAGAFQLNSEGDLVTALGYKVLDDSGQPITFPSDAANILIGNDGTVSAESGTGGTVTEVGKIGIYEFQNEKALESVGGSLYAASETPEQGVSTGLVQGAIEQSNVHGIEEMTRMIEVSRAYQRIAKLLETEHQRQISAIQRLGKASA